MPVAPASSMALSVRVIITATFDGHIWIALYDRGSSVTALPGIPEVLVTTKG